MFTLTIEDGVLRRQLRALYLAPALLLIIALLYFLIEPPGDPFSKIGPYAIALLGGCVIYYGLLKRSRFVARDGHYESTWALRRRFGIDDIEQVAVIDRMTLGAGKATHYLIVIGHRRRLAILSGDLWTRDQLTRIARDVESRGKPIRTFHEPIHADELRNWDRRTIPWVRAHYVVATIIAVTIIAVYFFWRVTSLFLP